MKHALCGGLLAASVLSLTVTLGAWGQSDITILYQDPLQFDRPADRCEAGLCLSLLRLIEGARDSIDFAIYGARHQSAILEALRDAQRRGVRVRGIVDRDREGRNYYSSTDEWVAKLGTVTSDQARESEPEDDGDLEPACSRPPGFEGPLQCLAYDLTDETWLVAEHASGDDFTDPQIGTLNSIMHHKFFVVDGRYVWTGSANVSDSGTGGYNANAVAVVNSPNIAGLYSAEFQRMVRRRDADGRKARTGVRPIRFGSDEVLVLFSPQDDPMRFGMQSLLARATRRIDVAIFCLTNKYVTAELISAHRRGVEVRVIVDATSATNGYTKHEILRTAGIPVKVENWGGKMHMKAAVIDDEFLVIGSMNWTRAGEDTNDENTLLIRSSRLAQEFSEFYAHLWQSIPEAWATSHARPDPESQSSGTSCTDGADNDFDGLADAGDPGCGPTPPQMSDLPPHRVLPKERDPTSPSSHRIYRASRCDPSYPDWYFCVPARESFRDLDCRDVPYVGFTTTPPDPHRFDFDGNGVGCEGS